MTLPGQSSRFRCDFVMADSGDKLAMKIEGLVAAVIERGHLVSDPRVDYEPNPFVGGVAAVVTWWEAAP